MELLNYSQEFGIIITNMGQTTGSLFITLLGIVVYVCALAAAFRIQLEYTAMFILPLLISCMAFYKEFLAVGGVVLIYLAVIMAKHFFFNK